MSRLAIAAWASLALAIIVSAVLVTMLVLQGYHYSRTIGSYETRAQVAADSTDMLFYMGQLEQGMRDNGATTGYTALIFKQPGNDLTLLYRTMQNVSTRLRAIEGVDQTSVTYQTALDDIRGIVREMQDPSGGLLWVRYGWWMGLIITVVWLIFLGVAGTWVAKET